MTEKDLAQLVAEAQRQGAPEWGVSVIVKLEQLGEKFDQHLVDHSKAGAPFREARSAIIGALAVAILWLLLGLAPLLVPK